MRCHVIRLSIVLGCSLLAAVSASAQTVGTFSWQLQPYCNRLTLTVTQQGGQYQLDGTDVDCAGTPSAARGMALVLADGTVRLGLTLVSATSAAPLAIDATISLQTLGGTWRDSAGNTGTLVYGANTGGASRPAATLAAFSVTTALLANGAVTTQKFAAGSVTSAVLADGSVATAKLANGAVTAAKIATGAVTGQRLGTDNVVIGPSSLDVLTTGERNTGLGARALRATTTGSYDTATGSDALSSNTTGSANTATGFAALRSNITGSYNIATGYAASYSNTSGNFNTATGFAALNRSTTGDDNTATGGYALSSNTTGNGNTGLGYWALFANTTGNGNTGLGYGALNNTTTGSNNTAVGYLAGPPNGSGALTNTTAIGNGATVSASNTIRLGNSSVTAITGQVAFTASSDRHTKEGFRPVDSDEVLRKLRTLEVTSWNYIGHDATKFRHYGPMAQDFFARFGHDEVGTIGTDVTLNSGDVSGILIAALQAADRRTDVLTATVERLERERTEQATELAELRALVETLMRQVAQPR